MSEITARTKLRNKIFLLLGAQMVDVELDKEHIDLAIDIAIEKLRQQSDGANLEDDIFLHITPNQSEYTLPAEVQEVRRLYRRGIGAFTAGGIGFDPASALLYNNYFSPTNMTGGMVTWDLFNGYMETAEKVLASQFNFTWDNNSKKLTLIRRPTAEEDVMVRVYVQKSEDTLINDVYTGPWLRQYATAYSKMMLGEARDKFPSGFAGPNGNVLFNGATMKQEAINEMDKLEAQLLTLITGSDGYGFIIG